MARAEDGVPHPVPGFLTVPLPRLGRQRQQCATPRPRGTEECRGSAIEAAVTPDGRLPFVSIEYSSAPSVVSTRAADT